MGCTLLQCLGQLSFASLRPSGVAKSSTSFGWGKGGNVSSAGDMSSHSGNAVLLTKGEPLYRVYLLTDVKTSKNNR